MKTPISRIFVSLFLLITLTASVHIQAQTGGQQTGQKSSDQQQSQVSAPSQSPLVGTVEAILVEGKPVLRILARDHGAAEIRLEKRDNEDALVFPVMHWHAFLYAQAAGESGRLYITKTRIVFEPEGDKGHFFNVLRTDVKKARSEKSGRFGKNIGNHVRIDAKGGDKRFAIIFNDNKVISYQGDYMKPALDFFDRAIENFDAAVAEFNQLTVNVRPEPEEEAEADEDEEAAITSKYDRFKDITIVRTSRMALRGGKRTLRMYADFSYSGKEPRQPDKVNIYFYAAAARPVFREDDLELNFLVDDERVPVGAMRLIDEDKTKSLIKQTVSVALPYETFVKIAKGKKVELQVGGLEYKLTDAHLDAFRKLLESVTNPPAEKSEE